MSGLSKIGESDLTYLPGAGWRIVDIADFNGDTKPDLLWRNYTTGANELWYMNGLTRVAGASAPTVTDFNWVIGGEQLEVYLSPVPAARDALDFNEDGTADVFWHNMVSGVNTESTGAGANLQRLRRDLSPYPTTERTQFRNG